jgi:hypothetical protein
MIVKAEIYFYLYKLRELKMKPPENFIQALSLFSESTLMELSQVHVGQRPLFFERPKNITDSRWGAVCLTHDEFLEFLRTQNLPHEAVRLIKDSRIKSGY